MKPKSKILIIAGSDSSGGAGIQADIKTVTALGSYAMTAITAVTTQNTTGVKSIVPINPKEISSQIEFTAKDIKPDAIKIGMLHSTDVIKAVIRSLDIIKIKKIILDPVMVAKSGTKLINDKAILLLKNRLIKKVSLITPNIPEAEILANTKIKTIEDMIFAASILINLGAKNVLIKGGTTAVFEDDNKIILLTEPRNQSGTSDFYNKLAKQILTDIVEIFGFRINIYFLKVQVFLLDFLLPYPRDHFQSLLNELGGFLDKQISRF